MRPGDDLGEREDKFDHDPLATGGEPRIADRCPSCGSTGTLFIGTGGYLTCSLIGCPNPSVGRAIDAPHKRLKAVERDRDDWMGIVRNSSMEVIVSLRHGIKAEERAAPAPKEKKP